ncbi:MAG: RNA methyltransferase [bacterium]|nr:RNA methyltransferase [bacterium]
MPMQPPRRGPGPRPRPYAAKVRPADGAVESLWISGRRPVLEALRAGLAARRLLLRGPVTGGLLADLRQEARRQGCLVEEVDNAVLDRVMRHTEHRGAALELAPPAERALRRELPELEGRPGARPLLLVLDGLQDPHNLGAAARSAEAAGVLAIVTGRWAQAPLGDAAFRASAGALAWLPVLVAEDLAADLDWLRGRGYCLVGLSERATRGLFEPAPEGPLALVLGGEGRGLSQRVREHLDLELRIPMRGRVASLNASVAAAVVLFHLAGREEA